jgi:hypothetical protein
VTWIKLDDQMPDHPKIAPRSDKAFRWIVRALSYANRFLTDGVLPAAFLDQVPASVRKELVTAAVWDRGPDGSTRIHNYKKFQPSRSKIERQRTVTWQRVRRFREREKETPKSRNAVTNAVTNVTPLVTVPPSRPGPSRTNTRRTPLTPLTRGAKAQDTTTTPISTRKASKDEKAAARKVRESWGECRHVPTCDKNAECLGRIVMDRRIDERRGMQTALARVSGHKSKG